MNHSLILKSYSNDDDWQNSSCSKSSSCWCRRSRTADYSYSKKNGCNCFPTDVRMASKEQVESLGGKFLTVEGSENLETEEDMPKKHQMILKNKKNY